MQENIMWLINAMVEQTETQAVIAICVQNNVLRIIADQISSEKKESTLLQTMVTLTTLSKEPELLGQFQESNVFSKLCVITNSKNFGKNIDLKTSLYQLLEVVSGQNPEICVRTSVYILQNQLIEEGFIIIMLRELNNNRYQVEKMTYDDLPDDINLSDDEGDADDFL